MGARRVGPRKVEWKFEGEEAQNLALLNSLSRHSHSFFFSLLMVLSLNFGGVFEDRARAFECARLERQLENPERAQHDSLGSRAPNVLI